MTGASRLFDRFPLLSAFLAEEVGHELGAFVGEDAGGDFRLGMEGGGAEGVVAPFVVGCAVDDAAYLTPAECAGTHEAGLYGDVECAAGQIFSAKMCGCRGDGLHFGMGGHVGERFRKVVGACYHFSAAYHYRSYRHFVACRCLPGFRQCKPHISFVVCFHFSPCCR